MLNLKESEYRDYIIYSVTRLKKKYGFRVKLIYGDNNFEIQQFGGFKTKREANSYKNVITAQLYNRTFVIIRKVRVEDFFNYWLENVVKKNFTYNTYYSYKLTVKNHIVPLIGNHFINSLNQSHIQKLYNSLYDKSPCIAKNGKSVMNSAFQFALDKQLISCNIVKNVNLPKKSLYDYDKFDSKYIRINIEKTLNITQINTLINASKTTPIYLHILFAVLMGLRKSEINGLKFSDVDFVHRKLSVQRQLGIDPNKSKEECQKKTYTTQEIKLKTFSSKRVLDIPDMVFEAILEERKRYDANRSRRKNDKYNPFRDLNYICCSTYGKPRSLGYIQKYYKSLLKENGLPNIRFHDLRHTYSTILLKNNYDVKAVSKLLGHAHSIITVDVYTDKNELAIDCLAELEPFINDVVPKPKNSENNYTNLQKLIHLDNFLED